MIRQYISQEEQRVVDIISFEAFETFIPGYMDLTEIWPTRI
jgi:hypothetical protein